MPHAFTRDIASDIETGLTRIAHAITPNAAPGHDETGGTVASLTEAVMGVTAGLCRIAVAIEQHAAAVEALAGALVNAAPSPPPPPPIAQQSAT